MMRLLYIIDWPSAHGGAHVATYLLLQKLQTLPDVRISVLGLDDPDDETRKLVPQVTFYRYPLYVRTWRRKWYEWGCQLFRGTIVPVRFLDPTGDLRRFMKRFDTVVVMSEDSVFRALVSMLPCSIRRVQMIHTDYVVWRKLHPHGEQIVRAEARLYARMDAVAVVGTVNAKKMTLAMPWLATKICPFHNLIDLSRIARRHGPVEHGKIKLVTLARMDDVQQKDGMRMIRVAKRLRDLGVGFVWDVYGNDGGYRDLVRAMGLDSSFVLKGFCKDVLKRLQNYDVMVLLSHYEGLPNVIYEAMVAGVPVFSTDVGGIVEQIEQGKNGWLVQDDEGLIVSRLKAVLTDEKRIKAVMENLVGYRYRNDVAFEEHCRIYAIP